MYFSKANYINNFTKLASSSYVYVLYFKEMKLEKYNTKEKQ